jgi:tight adherence protein B
LAFSPATDGEKRPGHKALIQLLPNRKVLTAIGAALAALIVWFVFAHPLMCFLTLAGLIIIPNKFYEHLRKKRVALIDSQVPDMLAMAAGAMSAGASLMTALESVARDGPAPIKLELDMMLREVRLGIDLDLALDHLAARVKSEEMVMVAAAIKIARESGGNLSESLEKLSRAVRDRQNMEKKILALTAQGRMQALVMAALPFFLLYALFRLDPVAMGPMFHTVAGWAVFLAVCFWIAVGHKVIKKLMDIDI